MGARIVSSSKEETHRSPPLFPLSVSEGVYLLCRFPTAVIVDGPEYPEVPASVAAGTFLCQRATII